MLHLPPHGRKADRLGWMDALRGLALTFVIFDHAVAHTVDYAGDLPSWLAFLTTTLNPLRMPLMVFLSGTLLSQSLAKGPAPYLSGKVRNILYPYLLWSLLYTSIWLIVSPLTGTPHSIEEYLWIFYFPRGHLWFIYYIFFYYVIMLFAKDLPKLPLAAALLVIAGVGTYLEVVWFERFFFLFAFFVLGHYATTHTAVLDRWLHNPRLVAGLGVVALGMPLAAVLRETTVRYEPASIPLAIAGIGLMIVVANRVGERPALALFRHLGRNSLPAYILHWMIIAALVITMVKIIGIQAPPLVFVVGCGGGFATTLLALWVIRTFRLQFLFAWPTRTTATAPRLAQVLRRDRSS